MQVRSKLGFLLSPAQPQSFAWNVQGDKTLRDISSESWNLHSLTLLFITLLTLLSIHPSTHSFMYPFTHHLFTHSFSHLLSICHAGQCASSGVMMVYTWSEQEIHVICQPTRSMTNSRMGQCSRSSLHSREPG